MQIDPGETKRVSTRVDGDGSTALRMRISANIGAAFDFTYWHPQIECGEVLTSWNPAPEDKVGNNEIISKINVSTEGIVIQASKVDLSGYVTFTNLSTSGQTTIDGGNITTGTIDASVVTVSNIDADNITAGTIQDAAGKNSWNLNTGAFTITQGSINIVTSSATYDQIVLQNGNFTSSNRASGLNVTYTSGADTFESGFGSGGLNVSKNGSIVLSTSVGSSETTFTIGDGNGTYPGILHLNGSQKRYVLGDYAGVQIQSRTNTLDRLILDFDTSTNKGSLQFCQSAASGAPVMELGTSSLIFWRTNGYQAANYGDEGFSYTNAAGVLRAKLDSNGLGFYYGASNELSAFYPANGTVQGRATIAANSSKTVTFSGNTLAIIGMLGSNGNMYGMWTYSGYGSGTARQHINAILGPGGGVSCAIDASTQSVTVTNGVTINCGLYVLTLVGSFPTIS